MVSATQWNRKLQLRPQWEEAQTKGKKGYKNKKERV